MTKGNAHSGAPGATPPTVARTGTDARAYNTAPRGPSSAPSLSHVTRVVDALGVVVVAMQLNVLWLLGTLAGLVILGAAPSAVAMATVVRRQMRGELPSLWPTFWSTWRQSFVTANLAHLPNVVLVVVAAANVAYFSRTTLAWLAWSAGLVVLGVMVLATLWIAPLVAHYHLLPWRYSIAAVRFVLLRPMPSVVLLLVGSAIVYASWRWAVLVPVVSVGALSYTATWLGVRTFDDNEARLADPRSYGAPTNPLPTQPLRMH